MKLAVTSTGPTLSSQLDPRFGRCTYFIIIDSDDLSFQSVPNPSAAATSGAGPRAAQLLVDQEVATVLTGECGPKASRALTAAGIDVITNCQGGIIDVVKRFQSGELRSGER